MHIKSIIAGAAIALVAGIASATAEEPFSYLEGVRYDLMTAEQLAGVAATGPITHAIYSANILNAVSRANGYAEGGLLTAIFPGPAEGASASSMILFNDSP